MMNEFNLHVNDYAPNFHDLTKFDFEKRSAGIYSRTLCLNSDNFLNDAIPLVRSTLKTKMNSLPIPSIYEELIDKMERNMRIKLDYNIIMAEIYSPESFFMASYSDCAWDLEEGSNIFVFFCYEKGINNCERKLTFTHKTTGEVRTFKMSHHSCMRFDVDKTNKDWVHDITGEIFNKNNIKFKLHSFCYNLEQTIYEDRKLKEPVLNKINQDETLIKCKSTIEWLQTTQDLNLVKEKLAKFKQDYKSINLKNFNSDIPHVPGNCLILTFRKSRTFLNRNFCTISRRLWDNPLPLHLATQKEVDKFFNIKSCENTELNFDTKIYDLIGNVTLSFSDLIPCTNGSTILNYFNNGFLILNAFDSTKNFANLLDKAHSFYDLTPHSHSRKGLYISQVSSFQEGKIKLFDLMRRSINFKGPTEGFSKVDGEIIDVLNTIQQQLFPNCSSFNHVWAQKYSKIQKGSINDQSDITKDMSGSGLIAFVSFYNGLEEMLRRGLIYKNFNGDFLSKESHNSILPKLIFTSKDNEFLKIEVPLFPNSIFMINLETNTLFTHRIQPSSISNEFGSLTYTSYMATSSNKTAINYNGKTFVYGDVIKPLTKATESEAQILKRLFVEENHNKLRPDYSNVSDLTLNDGDLIAPKVLENVETNLKVYFGCKINDDEVKNPTHHNEIASKILKAEEFLKNFTL